jgi:hypothetical protein
VLFKIAKDVLISNVRYLYGGAEPHDHCAMKAAAHELLGASHYYDYFQNVGLKIIPTMQTVVDFKGFRVVALPLLGISKNTLVYGSGDSGVTVLCDEAASKLMEGAAIHLHLASHLVKDKIMWSAGDVEVHRTNDGCMFLLDLARCFPPESVAALLKVSPDRVCRPATVFYRMIRPEALMYWKSVGGAALSPDALTGWGLQDKERHDQNIFEATSFVLSSQVQELAAYLLSSSQSQNQVNLSTEFHKFGVNLRHLFLVFKKLESLIDTSSDQLNYFQNLFASEMFFRILKNRLRFRMRDAINCTNFGIKNEVITCVNEILEAFSRDLHSVPAVFGAAIYLLEFQIVEDYGKNAVGFLLKCSQFLQLNLGKVLLRVFERCGILLEEATKKTLQKSGVAELVSFHESEIFSFSSTSKKMAVFDFLRSKLQIDYADSRMGSPSIRLREIAFSKLNECLSKFPLHEKLEIEVSRQSMLLYKPIDSLNKHFSFDQVASLWQRMISFAISSDKTFSLYDCASEYNWGSKFLITRIAIFLSEVLPILRKEQDADTPGLEISSLRTSKLLPEFISPQPEIMVTLPEQMEATRLEYLLLVQSVRFCLEILQSSSKMWKISIENSQKTQLTDAESCLVRALEVNTGKFSYGQDLDEINREEFRKLLGIISYTTDPPFVFLSNLFDSRLPPKLLVMLMMIPNDTMQVLLGKNVLEL